MIRVWKLGNVEHKIYPTTDTIEKFKKILEDAKSSNEEITDIIWGPDIECMIVNEKVPAWQGLDVVTVG